MDRRSYFISVLFLGAYLLCCFSDSKELSRESACYRDTLELDCGSQSIIGIHQAYFTSQRQENNTCHQPTTTTTFIEHEYIEDEDFAKSINHSYCYDDVRVSINRRCSGLKGCNFTYSDEAEKLCTNPDGVLIVHYDCIRTEKINKYCNAKITATEGYITQPGYPKYYPKLPECSWSLSAAEGQTINVKILHLHLSAAIEVAPPPSDHDDKYYAIGVSQLTKPITQCDKDSLSVLEGNVKLFSVCGQSLGSLRDVKTDANNDLVLKFQSSGLAPSSGFLAHFQIEGCPDMPTGEHIYLVERNSTAAIYACRNDLVFNDTLENTRYLYCIRNHHWSNTLSSCIQVVEEITSNSILSITANEQYLENTTSHSLNETLTTHRPGPRFTEDIMIPCIIIGILILGNSIIIIIICIMRRKQKDDKEEHEDERDDLDDPSLANL